MNKLTKVFALLLVVALASTTFYVGTQLNSVASPLDDEQNVSPIDLEVEFDSLHVSVEGESKLHVNESSIYQAVVSGGSGNFGYVWSVDPLDGKTVFVPDGDICSFMFVVATVDPYILSVEVTDLVSGDKAFDSFTVYDPYTLPDLYLEASLADFVCRVKSDGAGWFFVSDGESGKTLFSSTVLFDAIDYALDSTTSGNVLLDGVYFDYSLDIPVGVSVIECVDGLTRVFVNEANSQGSPYTISVDTVQSGYYLAQDCLGRIINSWTSTDEYTVFNSVYSSFSGSESGVVQIGNGVFSLNESLVYPDHVKTVGNGYYTTINGATGVNPVINFTITDNAVLESLTISGVGEDNQTGLMIEGADNCVLRNVNFRALDYGVYINSQGGNGVAFYDCIWDSLSFTDSAAVVTNGANQIYFFNPHIAGGSTVADRYGTAFRFGTLFGDTLAQCQLFQVFGGFLGYLNYTAEWTEGTQGLQVTFSGTEFEATDVLFRIAANQNYANYIAWNDGLLIMDGVLRGIVEGSGLSENSGSVVMNNIVATGTNASSFTANNATTYVKLYNYNPRNSFSINTPTELSTIVSCTSTYYKSDTTVGDVTGLSVTVYSGHKYTFEAGLYVSANAAGGHKYGIGGTATSTAFVNDIISTDLANKTVVLSVREYHLDDVNGESDNNATSIYTQMKGAITVNAGGTLTVTFAQNTDVGTSSVYVGSWLKVTETDT